MPPKKSSKARTDTPELLEPPSEEHRSDIPDNERQEEFEQPNDPVDPMEEPRGSVPLADEPTASLTEAIMLMTQELRRREKPTPKAAKAKEPDTFDGSDPKKLNNFIILCNLYFRS